MSLKDNIDMVKEELNSEEKFFEKAVITEKFVKKYKKHMIASFVIVSLAIVANIGYDTNKHRLITAANKALSELRQDATNPKAIADLKVSSPKLFDVWSYAQAVANRDTEALKKLTNSKALIVSDLAAYELSNDAKSFNEYALKQNAIYKDLALVRSAVILMKDSKIDEAHEKLLEISVGSSLAKIAKALLHYGVK